MIIDLKKMMQSGETERGFYFEYTPQADVVTVPNVSIVPPVGILGKVTAVNDKSATVDAGITFTLKGECTRCLGETEKEFHTEISEAFGENSDYAVMSGRIDLTKAVDDALVLAMPITFLCGDDCKGIEIK